MKTKTDLLPSGRSPTTLLTALDGHKVAREAYAVIDDAVAQRRHAVAARMAEVEREAEETFKREHEAIDKAVADLRKAEAAVLAASHVAQHAQAVRSGSSARITAEHDKLERELIATAAPQIAEFLQWVHDELCSRPNPVEIERAIETNKTTGRKSQTVRTNAASIHARLRALREAKAAAEELQLIADQSDVEAQLQRLRDSIPAIITK